MASGVYSIPSEFSVSVQNYFIDELRDKYPSGVIPMVTEDGEPYVSRIPYMESVKVSKAILDLDAQQAAANARLRYLDVAIHGRQIKLAFTARDMRRSGPEVINAKNKTIISKFLDEIDEAIWHGSSEGNVTVGTGLIEQLTDVAAAITEAQSTAQIAFVNMKAMITAISPKYRSLYPIALLIDWKTYDLVATGIATGFTEAALTTFKKAFPSVTVIPTDTILSLTADTVGTHGRMVAFAQHQDLVRNILVKPPEPAGPAIINLAGNIDQLWATFWGIKVIQGLATSYTGTQLTF